MSAAAADGCWSFYLPPDIRNLRGSFGALSLTMCCAELRRPETTGRRENCSNLLRTQLTQEL
jgi:hypothetical protein